MSHPTATTPIDSAEKTHNQRLYEEIGPQKLKDVKTAYVKGWITLSEFERDLEKLL